MRRLLLVVVLGCGGSSTPPAETAKPAPADPRAACEAAITKAQTTGRAGRTADPFDTKVLAATIDGCVETKWSAEMLLCFTNGTNETELQSCEQLLTPAQQEDMKARFKVLLEQEQKALSAPP